METKTHRKNIYLNIFDVNSVIQRGVLGSVQVSKGEARRVKNGGKHTKV